MGNMSLFNRREADAGKHVYRQKRPRHEGWYLTNRLYYLRKAKGITQEQLAQKANVSRATVSRIERSRHEPMLSLGIVLAEALDEPIEKRLYGAAISSSAVA